MKELENVMSQLEKETKKKEQVENKIKATKKSRTKDIKTRYSKKKKRKNS